jgi:hypothetical protein
MLPPNACSTCLARYNACWRTCSVGASAVAHPELQPADERDSAIRLFRGWHRHVVGGHTQAIGRLHGTLVLTALRDDGGFHRRRLVVYPEGDGTAKGTHLAVFLALEDAMWTPSAKYALTLVNQADASKSVSYGQ